MEIRNWNEIIEKNGIRIEIEFFFRMEITLRGAASKGACKATELNWTDLKLSSFQFISVQFSSVQFILRRSDTLYWQPAYVKIVKTTVGNFFR